MDSNKLGNRLILVGNSILVGLTTVFLIVIAVMRDLFLTIAGPEGPIFITIYIIYYVIVLSLGVVGIFLGTKKDPSGKIGGIEALKSGIALGLVTYIAIWSIILLAAVGDPSGQTITGMINLIIFIIVLLALLGGIFKIKGRNQ